ncbi:MAG: hypothetical protein EDM05_032035 [Leptolyngbya sp. IPPAS B-1204]|uniref:Uncharacterized protein n=1 Tax=Leptolyngbya sp. NK1-12 TaxID=2547451 RepID=A0AA96W7Y5_9CYAN|nr:hypothetical protein [Leptolyngbya sp. NK1-12]MBF2047631.1 hypothetical protein [Elainella sp. C42_A2020_010]RNJ66672.1 MAG: hypothetical protein EDM05_24065 [Leptolyngbya sp. IPPAS B-1204]WNZ21397.1 hypothetical protein HJG54_22040 [Leptolyngbya sp. NK1-12]
MTGKTALGSICASLILFVAVRSSNQVVQITASVVGAGLLGYTSTAFVLDCKRQQKRRIADAEAYLEFLRQRNQEQVTHTRPMPKVCRGCCHYHGRTYGGHLLVCAMHPYGVEDASCPDWQAQIQDSV